jgi:hypothetical protein
MPRTKGWGVGPYKQFVEALPFTVTTSDDTPVTIAAFADLVKEDGDYGALDFQIVGSNPADAGTDNYLQNATVHFRRVSGSLVVLNSVGNIDTNGLAVSVAFDAVGDGLEINVTGPAAPTDYEWCLGVNQCVGSQVNQNSGNF